MAKRTLRQMVEAQVRKVLLRGQRFERFDQIRQRHFWSSYLFAMGAGNQISAGPYEIFRITTSQSGQGYPAGITLTERETNWKGTGRVPDNQNFVIQELGVTIVRPPPVDVNGVGGIPANAPINGIWAALPPAIQALVQGNRPTHPEDARNVLEGLNLEMSFLTNNVPLGWCSDFSQSGGIYSQVQPVSATTYPADESTSDNHMGDPTNGVPAAAFRRKLEVPILLQHGEQMGMRLVAHRPIQLALLDDGGNGWVEVRVDWWATESFVEYS